MSLKQQNQAAEIPAAVRIVAMWLSGYCWPDLSCIGRASADNDF